MGGLYALVTVTRFLATISLAAGMAGNILWGFDNRRCEATEEFREYGTLEKYLEDEVHEVVFFMIQKHKKKKKAYKLEGWISDRICTRA